MSTSLKKPFAFLFSAALVLSFSLSCGGETARPESASDSDLEAGTATVADDRALVLFAAGDVYVSTPGAAGAAASRDSVAAGDFLGAAQSLSTGAESACELQFGERAVIRIDENTEVNLEDLLLQPGKTKVGLRLNAGTVLCKVEKLAGGESFQVRSRAAVCGVKGTDFGVTVAADENTILAVQSGKVSFLPAGFDIQALARAASGGDPELAASITELAGVEQTVSADEESELSPAAAERVRERVRTLEGEIKQYAAGKKMTPAEKNRMKTSFRRFRDDWRREVRGPRRMDRARRERLKGFDGLKRRRIEVVPRRPREKTPAPDTRAETRSPDGKRVTGPPAPVVRRSERLMRIQVNVEPRTAAVFLNGLPAGRGRFQGLFAAGDKLSFAFKLSDYVSQSLFIDLHPGVKRVYKIRLKPEEREGVRRDGTPEGEEGVPDETDATTPSAIEEEAGGRRGPDRPMVAQERPTTRPFVGDLAVFGNRIYAADTAGTVFCLDDRGRTVWKRPSPNRANIDSSPTAAGKKVYFAGADGILVLNAADGNPLDELSAADFPDDRFNRLLLAGPGPQAIPVEGGIEIVDSAGRGKPRRIDLSPEIILTLLVDRQYLFAADRGGMVRLFDLKTGRPSPRSIKTPVGDPIARGFFQPASCLYVAGSAALACVDPGRRRLKWEKPIQGGRVKPGALSVNETGVYVFAAERLFAFSHKGDPLFPPLEGVSAPPLALKNRLALGRTDGSFELLDARTGETLRRLPRKFKVTARPQLLGNFIAAGTEAGEILVINPAAMKPAGE